MVGTFHPLKLTRPPRELDDGKYALSWYEPAAEPHPTSPARPIGVRAVTLARSSTHGRRVRLVVDWDGTVTVRDSLVQVIHEFGDPALLARARAAGRRRPDAARGDRARVRGDHDAARRGRRVGGRERRGARRAAASSPRARAARHLGRLPRADRARARARRESSSRCSRTGSTRGPDGWRRPASATRPSCATCGEPCKRGSLAGEPYVYVGDGYSDRCAALAADRVFARDALAHHLDGLGVAVRAVRGPARRGRRARVT